MKGALARTAWASLLAAAYWAGLVRAESVSAPHPNGAAGTTARPDAAAPVPAEGMLEVPGGTFMMGADGIGERDERPAHAVTLKGFWLDVTEVTNAAYLECVAAHTCSMYREDVARGFGAGQDLPFRGATQPVVGVSWFDATAYCGFRGKRLPSEAEWERAARGADGRIYPWGNDPPDARRHACFGRKVGPGGGTTMPVASYAAGRGPYGHYDLTGNVWEWTADVYDPMAYERPTRELGIPGTCEQALESLASLREKNQQGYTGSNPIPTTCERVLRGGAFNYPKAGLRASNRVHHPPEFRILVAGFRCAKDL